jgi:hypothetical protein
MESESLTVNSLYLAFSGFEAASHDFDGITLANWNGSDFVLGLQILAQMATQDFSSQT